ncbi:natd1 [Trichonephila clavata]|uniref:Protein NATD1 n=1 Tax=Trichonephila clavata TaxID=2740835 RepID=A0A8X6FYL8_TRICU|nr:natd1 [Trichonephila clavata]
MSTLGVLCKIGILFLCLCKIFNFMVSRQCLEYEKEKAVLQYKHLTPSLIELEHTIVPESLQGKGLGKLLAEAAFEYAIDRKFTVKVTCGFVEKYVEKNPKPEFKSVLVK